MCKETGGGRWAILEECNKLSLCWEGDFLKFKVGVVEVLESGGRLGRGARETDWPRKGLPTGLPIAWGVSITGESEVEVVVVVFTMVVLNVIFTLLLLLVVDVEVIVVDDERVEELMEPVDEVEEVIELEEEDMEGGGIKWPVVRAEARAEAIEVAAETGGNEEIEAEMEDELETDENGASSNLELGSKISSAFPEIAA